MAKNKFYIMLLVASRGTGKTDLLKNAAKAYLKGNPGNKVLFIDNEDSPPLRNLSTWDDPHNQTPVPIITADQIPLLDRDPILSQGKIFRTAHFDIERSIEMASKYFYNGLLIMEDATKYINTGKLSRDQAQAIYASKQHGVHMMFAFHFIKKVPVDLALNTDHLILGKTGEKYDRRIEDRFPHREVMEAMERIAKSKDNYIKEEIYVGN